jgi:hypothetical protein
LLVLWGNDRISGLSEHDSQRTLIFDLFYSPYRPKNTLPVPTPRVFAQTLALQGPQWRYRLRGRKILINQHCWGSVVNITAAIGRRSRTFASLLTLSLTVIAIITRLVVPAPSARHSSFCCRFHLLAGSFVACGGAGRCWRSSLAVPILTCDTRMLMEPQHLGTNSSTSL